jgi:hypothetical protein
VEIDNYDRVASIDVGKKIIAVAVRTPEKFRVPLTGQGLLSRGQWGRPTVADRRRMVVARPTFPVSPNRSFIHLTQRRVCWLYEVGP